MNVHRLCLRISSFGKNEKKKSKTEKPFCFAFQILHVHAEDGDKGNPREIRYGLVSEGNPFTSFFNINDTTGKFKPIILE